MIVVSHRGPFGFVRERDGSFVAQRGAGGVVSALGPLLPLQPEPVTWIAAAMSADDRAAAAAGQARADGVDLDLLDIDPQLHRMHYDVVSNGVLWFLLHGMFDLVRRPRFDQRFREAWDAYVEVNHQFAKATVARAAENDIVLVQDYQLFLVPAFVRESRPDLRVVHFTHVPFCGPNSIRVLPDDVAASVCSSLAGGPAG